MHGDFGRLVLRLTYLFCNLVDLRIDFVEPVKRETPTKKMEGRQVVTEVDAEGCPSALEATSITSRRIRSRTGTIFLRLNHTGRSSNNTNYQRKPKKNPKRPR